MGKAKVKLGDQMLRNTLKAMGSDRKCDLIPRAGRKALDVMLCDGSVHNMSENEYWNTRSDFQLRVAPRNFIRIGDWHLGIGAHDMAVNFERTPGLAPVWEEPCMRDTRLCDCLPIVARALNRFPRHPLIKQLRDAMAHEVRMWKVTERELAFLNELRDHGYTPRNGLTVFQALHAAARKPGWYVKAR